MNDDRIIEHKTDYGTLRFVVTGRGTKYTNHESQRRAKSSFHTMARWVARSIHTRTLWNDADMRKSDLRDLRWLLDNVASYVEHVQRELDKIEGIDRTDQRIKLLREVAGRTPEETAEFLEKAAQLEQKVGRGS